jgi:hypothetical protein
MSTTTLQSLLYCNPSSHALSSYIAELLSLAKTTLSDPPQVKPYPDCVYFNYFSLGLSLLFVPKNGYRAAAGSKRDDLDDQNLTLDGIDIYNVPPLPTPPPPKPTEPLFSAYPVSPFNLSLSRKPNEPQHTAISISPDSTGRYFVETLGEPDRKGGGAGPSSGSIGIWCEWSKEGIMVEFGGQEARGPQAWERGKDAVWRVITVFPPKVPGA